MKAIYKTNGGKLEFEVEGSTQKEVFKELAKISEIFDEAKCGACGKTNVRYVVRNVEDNDYFELHCLDCRAKLAFGQHKKGGSLFPKRKDDEGKYLDNKGWTKWDGKKKEE